MSDFRPHIRRAVEIVGGQAELSRRIGMSQPSVHDLCHRTKRLRADVAIRIEEATNGEVSRSDLLPDVFPQGSFVPPTAGPSPAAPSAGEACVSPAASSSEAAA